MAEEVAAIDLQDLRCVAIHEYAHLHVARHFGIWGWVRIRASADRAFAGQFTAEAIDSAHARRVIGLAGACAEALDRERAITPSRAAAALRLSRADALMAAQFRLDDVAECLALLRDAWPEIVRDAHGAIELEVREAERAA